MSKLFIISAPSGAGKTSLVKRVTKELPRCIYSISHTTRKKRHKEIEGVDYFFVSINTFKNLCKQGDFLEYAKVFDNYYGTSKSSIVGLLKQNIDVILEIDWQGAQQIKTVLPASVSIFILPPSRKILEHRLRGRGQDSEDTISRRMLAATNEISHCYEYDYLIVNDQIDKASKQLQLLITEKNNSLIAPENYANLVEKLIKG